MSTHPPPSPDDPDRPGPGEPAFTSPMPSPPGGTASAGVGGTDEHPTIERYTLPPMNSTSREPLYFEGGMGRVYRGANEQGKTVAIKVPRPGKGEALAALWEREYLESARLQGETNNVAVLDVSWANWSDGRRERALVMEWLEGALPIDQFANVNGLDKRKRVELVRQACRGVARLHDRSRVHCDLKPGNLLVVHSDLGPCVKVTDLGAIRHSDRLDSAVAVCTTGYMSPEQCSGDHASIDARSDVYSLGRVLIDVVYGRAALKDAADPNEDRRIDSAQWLGRSDVQLDRLIARATQRRPADRFGGTDPRKCMEEFGEALDGYRVPLVESATLATARFLWPWDNALHRHRGAARSAFALVIVALCAAFLADRVCSAMHVNGIGPRFWIPTPTPTAFPDVAIIRIKPETDLAALAKKLGIDGVSASSAGTLRPLWELVVNRLVEFKAGAIGFDIGFPHRSDELDDVARRMCGHATKNGIPVTILGQSFAAIPAPDEVVHGLLAEQGVKRGSLTLPRPEGADLAVVVPQADETSMPRAPFAVHVAAGLIARGGEYQFVLDPKASALRIQSTGPGAGRELLLHSIEPMDPARVKEVPKGIQVGEMSAWYLFGVPADEVFAPVDVGIDEFLTGDPMALADAFRGRAVLLGNNSDSNGNGLPDDDMSPRGDHMVPGAWLQASAVQAILGGTSIERVGWKVSAAEASAALIAVLLGWHGTLMLLRSRGLSIYPDPEAVDGDAKQRAAALGRLSVATLAAISIAAIAATVVAQLVGARVAWTVGLVVAAAILGGFAGATTAFGASWAVVVRRANCLVMR